MEEDELIDPIEVNVKIEYIGEDSDEVITKEDEVTSKLLSFAYQSFPDLKEEYFLNDKITIYDIFEEVFYEDPSKAVLFYQSLLEAFSSYLSNRSSAYFLTEPFIEILIGHEQFNFVDYLKDHEELAQFLLMDCIYIPDCLVDILCELVQENNLEVLKKYIGFLARNELFESNGECMNFDEIIDTLKHSCDKENQEILEYLSRL